jgi:hypothetical protein
VAGVDEDPEVRRAAFDLYLALHNLADSQSFGLVITSVRDGAPGDTHDALAQLDRCRGVLGRRYPELVQEAHAAVLAWGEHRPDRLVQLIPLLDALAAVAGTFLPLQPPPAA